MRVCQNTMTAIAAYAAAAAVCPLGKLEPTGELSRWGTSGRSRPTTVVTTMNAAASRMSETTSTSGSNHLRHTQSSTRASTAVTAILVMVSASIDPMRLASFMVGVR